MPYPFQVTNQPNGTDFTEDLYRNDRQEIANAMIPTNIDDYSASAAQMQTATNPGEEGTESLATTLAGEIERLRFKIKQLFQYFNNGTAINYWYSAVAGILGVANGGTGASTAAGARANLGAAASGANSDITSISGLTTPLSVGQGGTGASTAAGARANLNAVGRDGDSRGSALSIGTTDNFGVNLITNNAARVTISNAGIATFNHQVKAKSGAGGAANPNDCGYVFSADDDTGLFNPWDGKLEIRVNGTLYFMMDHAADLITLGQGRLTFPTTQNPSADPNTLDDYEEGTWTPSYGRFGAQPTVTYTEQTGYYVKWGKVVHVVFRINASSVAYQGTEGLKIHGLPFPASFPFYTAVGVCYYFLTSGTGGENKFILEKSGPTEFYLYKQDGFIYTGDIQTYLLSGFATYYV